MRDQITPLILTFNEEPNLRRTLERLTWAADIVVLDSGSTDGTEAIARSFPMVRWVQRPFDTFAGQCNYGLTQLRTPWALSLDADYVLGPGFAEELALLRPAEEVSGFRASFTFHIHGHPLRTSLYPPRTVLYRRERARYYDEGHSHRVSVEGRVLPLRTHVIHDDRKPLDRWLSEQNRYALREVEHLRTTPKAQLNRADRIRRRMIVAPWLILFYTLFAKGLILDGWPGWSYAMQRTTAELILSLRLIEARLNKPRR